MPKDNVTQIKKNEKVIQVFSFEVTMLVHIVADSEANAKNQLDEKGGIMTERNVKLLNSTVLYGEKEKK